VLTGGELAAAIITDSIIRLLPGAISDETSALTRIIHELIYYEKKSLQNHALTHIFLLSIAGLLLRLKYSMST